jgi:hypothetical protein
MHVKTDMGVCMCNGFCVSTTLEFLSAILASILVLYMKLLEENVGCTIQHIKSSLQLTKPNIFQTIQFVLHAQCKQLWFTPPYHKNQKMC